MSFLQNLLNFITKYLKLTVDDDLSICVDEHSLCDLSITGDIKIDQCHMTLVIMLLPPKTSSLYFFFLLALCKSIKELFLLPKFDNSSPRN